MEDEDVKWFNQPSFVLPCYVVAFFPWVYFGVIDHITARWEPAQELVRRAWIALFVLLLSTAVLSAYIIIQFFVAGDTKEALAAYVVLLAGFRPYIRTAREFWIIFAFRTFERLVNSVPTFCFASLEKPSSNSSSSDDSLHLNPPLTCMLRFCPKIIFYNSSKMFDNDDPGDGVLDLSLKQWFVNMLFYRSAKRRRADRMPLKHISVQEFLCAGVNTNSRYLEFTNSKRYRDAMSICYYETRALKSTPFNDTMTVRPSWRCFVDDFFRDIFIGYPSRRGPINDSNARMNCIPWRFDYDHEIDQDKKDSLMDDSRIRQAWMYENVFNHTDQAERLLCFGFMVHVAHNVISSISRFCSRGRHPAVEGNVDKWKIYFRCLKFLWEGAPENERMEIRLLDHLVLSAPGDARKSSNYSEANTRFPASRKTLEKMDNIYWFQVAHLLMEAIELHSISRGLVESDDSLSFDGDVYEPALWNALFCRHIIQYRRQEEIESSVNETEAFPTTPSKPHHVGYGLPPDAADRIISADNQPHWKKIHENIKMIVTTFIDIAKRDEELSKIARTKRSENNPFDEIVEECNKIVRNCFDICSPGDSNKIAELPPEPSDSIDEFDSREQKRGQRQENGRGFLGIKWPFWRRDV